MAFTSINGEDRLVHPFRVAIVCAMWLTGFDVECLSTLYIDKDIRKLVERKLAVMLAPCHRGD